MQKILTDRMAATANDDFVIFLLGMRINKLWQIHKWLPVSSAMPKMLSELYANPEHGLLSHESWFGRTSIIIQYWKSFEHLENYAKNKNGAHLPAWADFNKRIASSGAVGIWHETYAAKKGSYENIYHNMPRFGLARAGKHLAVTNESLSARLRMKNQAKLILDEKEFVMKHKTISILHLGKLFFLIQLCIRPEVDSLATTHAHFIWIYA